MNTTVLDHKKMDRTSIAAIRTKTDHTMILQPNTASISGTQRALQVSGPRSVDLLDRQFESLNFVDSQGDVAIGNKSIPLLDDEERLLVDSEEQFLAKLKIQPNAKVKVVSIFGNTGEGKSYTLNQTFFDGEHIFNTSPSQKSCTLGVWAMYNPKMKAIFLDTEGLLGVSKKENQRTRMLLKVLAVSDVVIFRTRAERLQRDMYTFLGGASKAYKEHFVTALQQVLQKCGIDKPVAGLGPALIIFHETRYTDTLNTCASVEQSAEDIIRSNFAEVGQSYEQFSAIKYIGLKNASGRTSFKELFVAVAKELENTEVRSQRDAKYIFLTLKGLNEKFQSRITSHQPQLYLPPFFTCQDKCLSCGYGCTLSMGHKDEGEPHYTSAACKLQHQYQNFVYVCKKCYHNGEKQIVETSYQTRNEQFWSSILSSVWSGYVIECPKCGKIFQSREYWYGNKNPEDDAVLMDIVHVWPGEKSLFGSANSAQKVLDGVTSIGNALGSVSSQPSKMIRDWVTDQIAPSYWRPNHEITECHKCKIPFTTNASKHHCRACGEGFCERCSSKTQPVPSRGWHEDVRVCDDCYSNRPESSNQQQADSVAATASANTSANSDLLDSSGGSFCEVRARKIGETVLKSVSAVRSVIDISDFIKDTVRPSYWTPDSECTTCAVCKLPFGVDLPLHHCRDCGRGVCDPCSIARKPVPLRGWEGPVRVCDDCVS